MRLRIWLPAALSVLVDLHPARALVTLTKSQAVAGPRADLGSGACGTFIQYKRQGTPPVPPRTKQDAVDLLNKPPGDAALRGRISRLVDRVNFRNGQDGFVEGDFTGAMYPDQYLPYSQSSRASPMGDDVDIALRLRGYFNVPADLAGKIVSFGLNCDDFCSLRIGKTEVVPGFDITQSARVVKQVQFTDAGLYPIEMVSFQISGAAYLEWALAEVAQPECSQFCTSPLTDQTVYGGKFNVMPAGRLFSAIVGENRPCQECAAPGLDCSPGNYCGDGLCQDCSVPDHCGATCQACPAGRRICSAGACVQCTTDEQCPLGGVCDQGTCGPPTRCTRGDQCPSGRVCDPVSSLCLTPPRPCTTDAMCPAGTICERSDKICLPPCTRDEDCGLSAFCSASQVQVCRPILPPEARPRLQVTGCASAPGGPGNRAGAAGLFALLVLASGLLHRASRRQPRP